MSYWDRNVRKLDRTEQRIIRVGSPEWREITETVPGFIVVPKFGNYADFKDRIRPRLPYVYEFENDHIQHAMAISGMMGMHALRRIPKDWTVMGYRSKVKTLTEKQCDEDEFDHSYALFFADIADYTAFKLSL